MSSNKRRIFKVTTDYLFFQSIFPGSNTDLIIIIRKTIEIFFSRFKFIICESSGHCNIGKDIVALIQLSIVIAIINYCIFIIFGKEENSIQIISFPIHSKTTQGIFLGAGDITNNACDPLIKSKACLPGTVIISIFHYKPFPESSPVISNVDL